MSSSHSKQLLARSRTESESTLMSKLGKRKILAQLHALLQVLGPDARRRIVQSWMTPFQRIALENWIIERRVNASQSDATSDGESHRDSYEPDELRPVCVQNTRVASVKARKICIEGGCYVASIYVQWLEILGPARSCWSEATRDHTVLDEIKVCILRSIDVCMSADQTWSVVEGVLNTYSYNPALLRARVLVPTVFWIGTRLATPRGRLHRVLYDWFQLRQNPIWHWRGALHGKAFISKVEPSLRTLATLWEGLKTDLVEISVKAGIARSHVDARFLKLELQHRGQHGSLESKALLMGRHLLRRLAEHLQVIGKQRHREHLDRKRKLAHVERQRTKKLRERLRAEKNLTMEDILKPASLLASDDASKR